MSLLTFRPSDDATKASYFIASSEERNVSLLTFRPSDDATKV